MPISLDRDKTRTVKVEWGDETAGVTYYPNRVTPRWEEQFQQAESSTDMAEVLTHLLKSWEIVDENGEDLPPTVDVMVELPSSLLIHVFDEIRTDDATGEQGKGSGST